MRASCRLLVLISLFFSSHTEAWAARFYFDATGSVGNSTLTLAEGAKAPTLVQYSVGVTFGWQFDSGFLVGGTSDMRFMNQYSEPTDGMGNQQGSRFNTVSPTLGYVGRVLLVKADYQMMGDYELTAMTRGGESGLKYSNPKGMRLNVMFPVGASTWFGLMAESIEYQESNVLLAADTPETMTATQFGLGLTRTFGSK